MESDPHLSQLDQGPRHRTFGEESAPAAGDLPEPRVERRRTLHPVARGRTGGGPAHPVVVVWVLAAIYALIALLEPSFAGPAGRPVLDVGQGEGLRWFLALSHDRRAVWDHEYWRLLTGTFLHGGWVHLGLNLFGLVYVGRTIERWLGARRFLRDYFLAALAGALFFQASPGFAPGVGASGGILGLIGIYCAAAFATHQAEGPSLRRRFWGFLVFMFALLFLDGWIGGVLIRGVEHDGMTVAVSAHLGGFVAGLLLGYLESLAPRPARRGERRAARWSLAALIFGVGAYGMFAPVFDWSWHIWRAEEALAAGITKDVSSLVARAQELGGQEAAAMSVLVHARHGELEEALRLWNRLDPEPYRAYSGVGFALYDAIAARRLPSDGDEILDELIRAADREIARERTAMVLNDAAWFRAKRMADLDTALSLAKEAYAREPSGAILNTIGWVQFLQRNYEEGLANLEQAALDMPTMGATFLYLALAWKDKDEERARRYVERAEHLGLELAHERELLEEVRASLASS